jgi:hypothetical protein
MLDMIMIEEIIQIFSTLIKLAPRYFMVIGAASCVILLVDQSILSRFGLLDFENNYRPWIAIAAFCGIGFIMIDFIMWCWKRVFIFANRFKISQDMKRYLRGLTEEEKEILRFYLLKKTRTNSLRPDDGIVNGLETAGIIYAASEYGSILNGHPFNISPPAWKYLNKRPYLLHGTTSIQRTDKIEWNE